AYCLLLTAYCLLLTAYCLLLTAYCLLLIACCLLPAACWGNGSWLTPLHALPEREPDQPEMFASLSNSPSDRRARAVICTSAACAASATNCCIERMAFQARSPAHAVAEGSGAFPSFHRATVGW
ncbi:hypothetical protein, partial [Xanthomonas hortorum]|uniref:hypothetical protein n=1 Tax=Xanthomonas hortorum TaxID=56454 RepID=UPI0032E86A24